MRKGHCRTSGEIGLVSQKPTSRRMISPGKEQTPSSVVHRWSTRKARIPRTKFGFVHLVDGTREAGYRGLTPHLPERVSHGSPAERDCTRPAGVRGCLQRADMGLGPGAGGRGDPDAGPTDGGGGAARDGAER